MRREPPIDQPTHPYGDVEEVEFYCFDCDTEGPVRVDSLEADGVSVICPSCAERFFVVLA